MPSRALTSPNRDYALGLGRAFAGAIIFGLPLLMTMEMWFLGISVHPARLLVFLAVNFAILVGLSRFGGFERTDRLSEDVMDALAACGVGIIGAAAVLFLLAIVNPAMPLDEIAGKIAIQSVPMSFGAMIARKQLSGGGAEPADEEAAVRGAGYGGQLFLMAAGALFLSFNVAPTEEMLLIAYMMSTWHLLALVLVSLILLHLFVYRVGFRGQKELHDAGPLRTFLAYTIPGYAIALAVGLFVLWTFGRVDGTAIDQVAATMAVIAFPGALGAAIARLVV
ncbi:MAG TPA: TIGR02587 family membrane protein [Allosphingosinicella sp.]|nr:TIGR02587 family membrane protein [Allosphingosinicella sp.]